MRLLTLTVVAGLAAGLAVGACAPFPKHGSGGFAEHRPTIDPDYVWDPVDWGFDPSAEPRIEIGGHRWVTLHDYGWTTYQVDRLDCADFRLDALLARGANGRFPAHVWRAVRERRVALRLLSGGLEWDGERALSTYEDTVEDLAIRLGIEPSDIRDVSPDHPWRTTECSPVSTAVR